MTDASSAADRPLADHGSVRVVGSVEGHALYCCLLESERLVDDAADAVADGGVVVAAPLPKTVDGGLPPSLDPDLAETFGDRVRSAGGVVRRIDDERLLAYRPGRFGGPGDGPTPAGHADDDADAAGADAGPDDETEVFVPATDRDTTRVYEADRGDPSGTGPTPEDDLARCPACGTDLTALGRDPTYCPDCGEDLTAHRSGS